MQRLLSARPPGKILFALSAAIGIALSCALFAAEPKTGAAATKGKGARIAFTTGKAAPGTFPAKWIHGAPSLLDNTDPPLQVHWYNDHTVILRENKAYNYEGCFLYLLFGNDRAILWDQGSTAQPNHWPLREVIDRVIAEWCQRNGRRDIELVITNTHLHGDHYAAWNQFVDRPNTVMVGLTHEERMAFFKITNYPEQRVEFDLGGRTLLIWGSPGHEESEVAFYDPYTQLLCTADMFYRGRCYIGNWKKWMASMERLVKFADEFPISHLVNCHIEISAKGDDYPRATTYQPDEPPMQMDVASLRRAYDFAKTLTAPGIYFNGEVRLYYEVRSAMTSETNPYAY
jgi:glyoxylase-like metal-dependent hydrolase (beta-lactamase superfamily II)